MCVRCWAVAASRWSLHPLPFLNRGERPPKKRRKKHYQLLSPCPTPFQQLIHVTVQVTLRLQCGHWAATADEVDLLTETRRTGMPSLGESRVVMMAKLQNRSLLPKLRWTRWTSLSLQIAKLPVAARRTSSCVDQVLVVQRDVQWLHLASILLRSPFIFCNKKHFFTNLSAILIDFRTETAVRLGIRIRVGEPYSYTLAFGSATNILTKRVRIRIQRRRLGETCSTEATQGPEATQPDSTCVQTHSRSLRIHFTAEFAPFFHSRKVNS